MATTRTTTTTSTALTATLGGFATLLAVLAVVNLFGSMLPLDARNAAVESGMQEAEKLPFKEKIVQFAKLREEQEKLLAQKPTEPYAWARLAHLRNVTQGNARGAIEALKMSDMVSPYDGRQTLGRAEMWRKLQASETEEEKAYQATLWQKAGGLDPKGTWEVAAKNGWVKEVEAAIATGTNQWLIDNWREQMRSTGQR